MHKYLLGAIAVRHPFAKQRLHLRVPRAQHVQAVCRHPIGFSLAVKLLLARQPHALTALGLLPRRRHSRRLARHRRHCRHAQHPLHHLLQIFVLGHVVGNQLQQARHRKHPRAKPGVPLSRAVNQLLPLLLKLLIGGDILQFLLTQLRQPQAARQWLVPLRKARLHQQHVVDARIGNLHTHCAKRKQPLARRQRLAVPGLALHDVDKRKRIDQALDRARIGAR